MNTICGIDCTNCGFKCKCGGCKETNGHPLGGACITAECYKAGGEECFIAYKNRLIEEFNSLGINDMPIITNLVPLCGEYINSEYILKNGARVKFLEDSKIYLGYQVEKINSDQCYGLAADNEYLLVCEYGCNGANPVIIVYKKY